MTTRIAPTPSGYLHTGNAFNFLLAEALALRHNGALRLRIDDLDAPRARPEYIADVFETLRWLGIHWQAGPRDAADHHLRHSQQQRLPRYAALTEQLVQTGLVFACECSRRTVLAQSPDGQYAGACIHKRLPLDTPGTSLRIRTPEGKAIVAYNDALTGPQHTDLYTHNRHFIIRRADGPPAYHIASLCDDVDAGITHIVRGLDLRLSTAAQLYLARLVGAESFLETSFYHHPLLSNPGGAKLSKSAGSQSLKALRESGMAGSAVRTMFEEWRRAWDE